MSSESFPATPRLSFSHDFSHGDLFPDEEHTPRMDGSLVSGDADVDFDFSVSCEIAGLEPSPADEIFSGGKILPLPLKGSPHRLSASDFPAPPPEEGVVKRGNLREMMMYGVGGAAAAAATGKKPFCWFPRSSSAGDVNKTKCPFPLSRSRSTGSNGNLTPSSGIKRRGQLGKVGAGGKGKLPSVESGPSGTPRRYSSAAVGEGSARAYYYSTNMSRGSGVRVSPVINLPGPCWWSRGNSASSSSSSSSTASGGGTTVFGYLLCKCSGSKSMRQGTAVACLP